MIGNYNYGTGRRKSSVARVFIKRGTGKVVTSTISSSAKPAAWSSCSPCSSPKTPKRSTSW